MYDEYFYIKKELVLAFTQFAKGWNLHIKFWQFLNFFLAILVESTVGKKIQKFHNAFVEKWTKFILIFIFLGYCNTNLRFFSSTFTLKLFWKCFTNPKPTENSAWSHGIKCFFCDQTSQYGGSPSCQTNETNAERQWDKNT